MSSQPQTWHYGIIAQHWAEFENYALDAPEIAYYQAYIERKDGQPALDAGCGTGRLLLPFLRAGLDVDGSDISPDMIRLAREKATREGLSPQLYAQTMHELDLPRTYQTILLCGAFGIGSTTRERDLEALRRFHQHLELGGLLLFDTPMPYVGDPNWLWPLWQKENREHLDPNWWPDGKRERASDGRDFVMRSRIADVNPLEQVLTLQMRAEIWQADKLLGQEERTITSTIYFKNELVSMLKEAGFSDIQVHGDYTNESATVEHQTLVFIARK